MATISDDGSQFGSGDLGDDKLWKVRVQAKLCRGYRNEILGAWAMKRIVKKEKKHFDIPPYAISPQTNQKYRVYLQHFQMEIAHSLFRKAQESHVNIPDLLSSVMNHLHTRNKEKLEVKEPNHIISESSTTLIKEALDASSLLEVSVFCTSLKKAD